MSKSKPSNPPAKAKAKKTVKVVASSSEEEESETDDEDYIFKPIHHHQHLQDAEEWNTVVNTKKIKREERYDRKKEREAEQAQALAAEQERYRQQNANNPYAKLLAPKVAPQYNAQGRKKLAPKVHKYVHSPEDEEEIVAPLTNFEKVQQKKAERSKKNTSKPSTPAVIINNESDLVNTIAGILDRSPEPYLPVATAAAELAKLTKTSWQDTYKRTYGSLATFLQSHDDTFAVIDGDKLFLKPRLEAFLQTTIGRPKKKKVKAVSEESNGAQGKKKKNKQNGIDTHEHDTDSSDIDESTSSSSACGRCCSTLFLLIMSLVLIGIIVLVGLSIKRITVAEAWAHVSHITHPYTERIQHITRPYVEQIAVHVTQGLQQIQARWEEYQSKQTTSS